MRIGIVEIQYGSTAAFQRCCASLFLCFLMNLSLLQAQTPTQTIRGQVIDADTEKPLSAASVQLFGEEMKKATTTDETGRFRFENLAVGRYELSFSFLGYEPKLLSEVLVESGKEVVLRLALEEQSSQLEEVLVRASRNQGEGIAPLSEYTITVEETRRFPATFNDPARLAMSFAGVAGDNDQTNNIVVRGNSPVGLSWRLEGVDIVNPNHLSNAGTFSDRAAQSGGGVNILSAQLLGNSTFLTGAFPAEYGNTLAGVMDMHLRKGNDEQHEFTGQFSLLGLDLAAEGPMGGKGKASYLINYRYSTIGLLNVLGVELGDEAISFQDLAFNLSIPTANAGRFTIFGMGGLSKNVFETPRDTAVWEFEKDRFDIRFESKMGALGVTHVLPIGDRTVWRNVVAFSIQENIRRAEELDINFNSTLQEEEDFLESRLSFSSSIAHKLNSRNRLKTGLSIRQQQNQLSSFFPSSKVTNSFRRINGDDGGWLIQPYLNWQVNLTDQIQANAGLHYVYYTFNQTSLLEPRASLSWRPNQSHKLSLAYGLHNQLQRPQLYFEENSFGNFPNRDLGMTRAHHGVLAYQYFWTKQMNFKAELYYQSLFDVPILDEPLATFSALNMVESFRRGRDSLMNTGTGKNYGLELSLQRYIADSYYFLINSSIYESRYTGGDGVERDTRFNGNYIFNLTLGKEFSWNKEGKDRLLGLNLRATYLGGFRETPIDTTASATFGYTVYESRKAFSLKQKDYFKVDLRIYYKNNKPGFSSTLALDIQNVSNAKNEAYRYFDNQQQAIVVKNQLGLIPILSYRITF